MTRLAVREPYFMEWPDDVGVADCEILYMDEQPLENKKTIARQLSCI